MALTKPYYSTRNDAPRVYHDRVGCRIGTSIPAEERRYGIQGRSHCRECRELAIKEHEASQG